MSGSNQVSVLALESLEDFDAALARSSEMLSIVEVHAAWCGPCQPLVPHYQKIFLEHAEGWETRCAFQTITLDKVKGRLAELLADGNSEIDLDEQGCAPLFLVLRYGQLTQVIRGANPPALTQAVKSYIPEAARSEDEED